MAISEELATLWQIMIALSFLRNNIICFAFFTSAKRNLNSWNQYLWDFLYIREQIFCRKTVNQWFCVQMCCCLEFFLFFHRFTTPVSFVKPVYLLCCHRFWALPLLGAYVHLSKKFQEGSSKCCLFCSHFSRLRLERFKNRVAHFRKWYVRKKGRAYQYW